METNRVVITLHKGTDVLGFMAEMSQVGNVSPYVPDRAVEIANPKHDSLYNVDFTMTHDEFLRIQQDPRVRAARWGSKADNGIVVKNTAQDAAQPLYRNPDAWNTNQDGNWGRAACSNITNPFPTNISNSSIASFVRNYTLDGSGVDVIVMDDGIEATHPDWNDASGNTRLHLVDWLAYPVITGASWSNTQQITFSHAAEPAGAIPPGTYVAIEGTLMPLDYQQPRILVVASNATSTTVRYDSPRSGNITGGSGGIYWWPERGEVTTTTGFYTDTSGHGTNVASIAAGRRYGWATGAGIYFMNIYKVGIGFLFNLARIWHSNKPVGENGLRRPTVINCSFGTFFQQDAASSNLIVGYSWQGGANVLLGYDTSNGANYANVGLLGSVTVTNPGFVYANTDALPSGGVASQDSEVEGAIDEGVIVIAAAANDYYKIDIPGGVDYNNFAIISNTTVSEASRVYYHRGSSPSTAEGVITVGAVANTFSSTNEIKATFSRTGPGVDIWAPGQAIAGACSNTSSLGASPLSTYPENTNYRTAKVTGTSQATPQVTGVVATLLQARPWLNQTGAREAILQASVSGRVANVNSGGGYTDVTSLQTSTGRYLRTPFTNNIVSNLSLGGTSSITGSF